jgi:hypothetical protein
VVFVDGVHTRTANGQGIDQIKLRQRLQCFLDGPEAVVIADERQTGGAAGSAGARPVDDPESLPSPYTDDVFTVELGRHESLVVGDGEVDQGPVTEAEHRLRLLGDRVSRQAGFLVLGDCVLHYRDAYLDTATDPNLVHDLRTKLDTAGLNTPAEVEACATAWLAQSGNNAAIATAGPAAERFKSAYLTALTQADKAEQDRLDLFRKDVGTYVRVYDFLGVEHGAVGDDDD